MRRACFFFGLAKVFVPAFYALQDTRTPFHNGLKAVGINFSLNIVCTFALASELKAESLAAAAVLAEAFNGLTLGWQLRRHIGSFGGRAVFKSALRSLTAAAVMGLVISLAYPRLAYHLATLLAPGKMLQFAVLLPSLALGFGVYLLAAIVLRCPEIRDVRAALAARRRGGATVPPPEAG